jgi:hypothetical protein
MLFPENSKSVLYFGWGGSQFCYGSGTNDPALNGTPCPCPGPQCGQIYCYDPVNLSTGTHGYPYKSIVYAYNFGDFVSAKAGTLKPWEVVPYDVWDLELPFQERMVNGVDMGIYNITGAAYRSQTKEVFLAAQRCDGDRPVIHVLGLP